MNVIHDHDLSLADEETSETSSIELFLEAAGLSEFIPNFAKEKIDLEALMLLEEIDLEKLGLPLGPRKKLHKAIQDRRDVIEEPGEIIDTHLWAHYCYSSVILPHRGVLLLYTSWNSNCFPSWKPTIPKSNNSI